MEWIEKYTEVETCRQETPLRIVRPIVVAAIVLVACTAFGEVAVRRMLPALTRRSQLASLERLRASWSRPDAQYHHVGHGIFRLRFPQAGAPGPRVLIVGDSFAMGHGVGQDGRFGAVLQRRLGPSVHVDVLAVSSYSPVIYRTIVRTALQANDYAVVAVYVDQTDPADEVIYFNDLVAPDAREFDVRAMRRRDRRIDEAREAVRRDLARPLRASALFNLLWPAESVDDVLPADDPAIRDLRLSLSRPLLMHAFQRQPDGQLSRTMEALLLSHLDEIVDACHRAHVPLLLAANPWEQQVVSGEASGPFGPGPNPRPNRLERLLTERYAALPGVNLIPLTQVFRAQPRPGALFLDDPPGEVHWNEAGHALVADVLFGALPEPLGERAAHGADGSTAIRVTDLDEGQEIRSPLKLTGEVPGTWLFEGSFPIVLKDWNGKIIAQSRASTAGDWTTDGLVPFSARLDFESPYSAGDPSFKKRGTLVLQRDNPSGLQEHDASREIAVLFAE